MPGKARKINPDDPDFMKYESTGDLLQAFLTDAATDFEAKATTNGTSALAGATLRIVLQAAHQLREVYGLNDEPAADENQAEESGWQS